MGQWIDRMNVTEDPDKQVEDYSLWARHNQISLLSSEGWSWWERFEARRRFNTGQRGRIVQEEMELRDLKLFQAVTGWEPIRVTPPIMANSTFQPAEQSGSQSILPSWAADQTVAWTHPLISPDCPCLLMKQTRQELCAVEALSLKGMTHHQHRMV